MQNICQEDLKRHTLNLFSVKDNGGSRGLHNLERGVEGLEYMRSILY